MEGNRKARFEMLMDELGRYLGLEGVDIGVDGVGCLCFDEKITVHIVFQEETGQVLLYADLGVSPEGSREDIYRALLSANLMRSGPGDAALALNPENDHALLVSRCLIDETALDGFVKRVESLVNGAESWIERLEGLGQPATEAPPSPMDIMVNKA